MIADWINSTFHSFDYAILEFCHWLAETAGGFFGPVMNFLTVTADNGYALFALAVLLLLFPKTRKTGICVAIAVIVGIIFTNLTIKNIVARPRPYASDVEAFKEWWTYAGAHLESKFSFPSGHTTAAASAMAALCLCLFKKHKWIIAPTALYALVIGFSRNYFIVHYPSDVLAGIIVGVISALIALFITALGWKFLNKRSHIRLFNFFLNFDVRRIFKRNKTDSENENADDAQV